MRIDAHQHYWSVAHGDYGWLVPSEDLRPIYRDFAPADLHPLLDAAGIDATVLVQAAPSEAETWRLLETASQPGSRVLGVVGWCDFEAADAADRVRLLARQPLLRGLRPMLQDLPDPAWILRAELEPALAAMQSCGLVLDLLVKPVHLEVALTLAARWPGLTMVIDHGAKPVIDDAAFQHWAAGMRALAQQTALHCKLSGLLTELPRGRGAGELWPYVEVLLAAFGPSRLIWGSDWPVLTLAADYAQWHGLARSWLAHLGAEDLARVFGGNAMALYGTAPSACSRG
jgi:L-fuconolactonase